MKLRKFWHPKIVLLSGLDKKWDKWRISFQIPLGFENFTKRSFSSFDAKLILELDPPGLSHLSPLFDKYLDFLGLSMTWNVLSWGTFLRNKNSIIDLMYDQLNFDLGHILILKDEHSRASECSLGWLWWGGGLAWVGLGGLPSLDGLWWTLAEAWWKGRMDHNSTLHQSSSPPSDNSARNQRFGKKNSWSLRIFGDCTYILFVSLPNFHISSCHRWEAFIEENFFFSSREWSWHRSSSTSVSSPCPQCK